MSQAHHHATPLTYALSFGSATLTWIGSHVHGAFAAVHGIDISQLAADLAHFGGFLAAFAAFGTFVVNMVDRCKGRHKGPAR